MATNGSEQGEIVIPSQEWVEFKERVRAAFNEEQERRYRLAVRTYEMTLEAKESEGGVGWRDAGRSVRERLDLDDAVWSAVRAAMYRNGPDKRPLKPRKMDFPLATNRTTRFELDGKSTITLDNNSRTATWHVADRVADPEAVRQTPVAKAFVGALDAIGRKNAWTTQSGGTITRAGAPEAATPGVLMRYGTGANRENTARYGDSSRW